MADDRKKDTGARGGPGGDMARKIWLAGIGAYGRAFSEAQESLAKVSDETSKLFEDLVERGETIEDTVESRGRDIAQKVRSQSFSLDDRIREMRERLKKAAPAAPAALSGDAPSVPPAPGRLDLLEARLEQIDAKLDLLIAHLAAPDSATTASKAASNKKTAKKASKKTAKKKAPARKVTTKKTTTKKTKKKSSSRSSSR